MRNVATVCLGLAVAACLGCTEGRWGMLRRDTTPAGAVSKDVPSVEALVNYMNENASRTDSVRCNELDLTCSQGLVPVALRGKMLCQRPKNFRMTAELFGKTEVDLGSNQQEFWYWIKRGDPYQVHCSYQALTEGKVRQIPFPFQPEWIMEAMGIGQYGPADRYQMQVEPEKLRLVESTTSLQGDPVKKVIVFNRREAKGSQPQVTDFLLLDRTGKEICSAHISEVQVGPRGGTLPRKMELRWPEQKLKLGFTLTTTEVNIPINAEAAFRRMPLSGVQSLDLATGRVDAQPNSLQRVGGYGKGY